MGLSSDFDIHHVFVKTEFDIQALLYMYYNIA